MFRAAASIIRRAACGSFTQCVRSTGQKQELVTSAAVSYRRHSLNALVEALILSGVALGADQIRQSLQQDEPPEAPEGMTLPSRP